jgi:uncharacterized SAM-binding protein YcdF (DUF218 family)
MHSHPTDSILDAAMALWHYHQLREAIAPADGILVFGSNDLRVADYAAQLYHQNLAPWILFSGGRGRMTEHWHESEAACFAERARSLGVPASAILCESLASHTGENIAFSRKLLEHHGLHPRHLIVLQKPYMERRTRAALEMQWPQVSIQLSSPPIPFTDYPNELISRDDLIHAMVGDFYRIIDYPGKGLATEQFIPASVREAYEFLVQAGYTHQCPGSNT